MSEFRIDQIKSQDATRGPDVAGITTFTGVSGIVMPSGVTSARFAKDFITDGLVLYVDISETYDSAVGNSIFDPVSGIRDEVLAGSPTFSAADSTGPDRLVFNGVDDGILFDRCDPILGFGPGDPLTISVWVKVDKDEEGVATIFSIQRCNNPGFQIWIEPGAGSHNNAFNKGRIAFRMSNHFIVDTRTGEEQVLNGQMASGHGAPYVDGRGYWVNIVATYVGKSAKLYINGKLSGFHKTVTYTWTAPTNPTSGSAIGIMRRYPCGNSGYTKGEFNHCAMYRKELSSQEVLHNYNVLKGRFGL